MYGKIILYRISSEWTLRVRRQILAVARTSILYECVCLPRFTAWITRFIIIDERYVWYRIVKHCNYDYLCHFLIFKTSHLTAFNDRITISYWIGVITRTRLFTNVGTEVLYIISLLISLQSLSQKSRTLMVNTRST